MFLEIVELTCYVTVLTNHIIVYKKEILHGTYCNIHFYVATIGPIMV